MAAWSCPVWYICLRPQAPVVQALQECQRTSVTNSPHTVGRVKVQGRKAVRIPGGALKIVPTTCSEKHKGTTVLFEPLDSGPPAGLLAAPALVQMENRTAYIPIVNVGSSDVLLYPRTVVSAWAEANITSHLPSGYNQVPVAEAYRSKTAFCSPFGLFEWNRMPFGLCNASSTFQRLMQWIFGDQQCQSLLLCIWMTL